MPKERADDDKGYKFGAKSLSTRNRRKERSRYTHVPLFTYKAKDIVRQFLGHKNLPDAISATFAAASVAIVFPFFPIQILIPLLFLTFVITMIHPLAGLIVLLFETLPMLIFQVPLLAWIFCIFVSIALILGYKHYRSITLLYTMIVLPFSFLGWFLEIPAFIIGTLFIGFKRAAIVAVLTVILVSMISGLTGISNTGMIAYNSQAVHTILSKDNATAFFVPSRQVPTLSNFTSAAGQGLINFFGFRVSGNLFDGFRLAGLAIFYGLPYILLQMFVWFLVVFAISDYVIRSRSPYKGIEASFFSFIILFVYFFVTRFGGLAFTNYAFSGFLITPAVLLVLELNNVDVVKSLEVMKKDFLGRFGDAFEDLTASAHETLKDVANYDETKKELQESILSPIEHREISGAYNVKPAKGILLFGPPGTGKTLVMRAIANEIRAGFFYVKTSSILSKYEGESAQMLSRIFDTAKSHAPAILFFDEIDGIASKREMDSGGSNRQQLMTTLLAEMDGFQKLQGVVVVGSTNVPQLIDQSIMRPGRFDKVIYMPLPDKIGREKIFKYYLGKLPINKDMDYGKIAQNTPRFSGADIKNVCEEVARIVAEDAVKRRVVLEITTADVLEVAAKTKPSVSLASIENYNKFKMDYERRQHQEAKEKVDEVETGMNDVVGLDEAKKALYEAIELPILHPSLVNKYGVDETRGILLFGPPGTGKTLVMKALSNDIKDDAKFITASGSEIVGGGSNNALTRIKELFDRARENAPAVVFIDEIDSVLPLKEGSSESAQQIISEFLQQMDGIKSSKGIVVVGATNRPEMIDPALLRSKRFDRIVYVGPPKSAERKRVFQASLKGVPLSKDVDFDSIADRTSGYTGADIINVCRIAKLRALERSIDKGIEDELNMSDLEAALKRVKASAPNSVIGKYLNFMVKYGIES